MVTIFGPAEYKDYYKKIVDGAKIKEKLTIHQVNGGSIIVDNKNESFGVVDRNNLLVKESISSHRTHAKHMEGKCKHYRSTYYDEDAVYCGGGMAIKHFGHFLVEGINRIYPIFDKKYGNCKFVFAVMGKKNIPNYMFEILRLAGIPEKNIIFTTKSLRFNNVYIPDEAFDWGYFSSHKMAEICGHIADSVKRPEKTYDKIYVSRLKTGDRHTIGENIIQNIFEKNGYKVIYPEQLPVQQQIGLVKNCSYLAGVAGTALHLALFMRPGGTVIQVKRNLELEDNFFVQNLINQTNMLNSILVWGSIEKTATKHFTKCPQIIGPTDYFIEFLRSNNFSFSAEDLIIPKDTLDEYKTELARYNVLMGGKFSRGIKKFITRLFSCFIPGRHNRKVVREFLEHVLHYEKDF